MYIYKHTNTTISTGASPDGVVVWADGTVEALEAKNHSPFRDNPMAARVRFLGGWVLGSFHVCV